MNETERAIILVIVYCVSFVLALWGGTALAMWLSGLDKWRWKP